jgi:hypothetical protein
MAAESDAHESSSDAEIVRKLDEHTPRTAWRILARNQARNLFDQVREIEAEGARPLTAAQQAQVTLIRQGIWRAVAAAAYTPARPQPAIRSAEAEQSRPWEALKDWYSGAGVETTWTELHRAEERLLLVQDSVIVKDRVAGIDAALRSNLKQDDVRLTPAAARLKAIAALGAAGMSATVREELRGYQQLANTASDEAHRNVRSLRNLLIVIGSSISLVLAIIAILHAIAPGFFNLSGPKPANGASAPDAIEVWEVLVVGALGGVIAAAFTISKLGGFSGPYRLPVYQALIRVPAGSAVALAAVLLLQSNQIKGLSPQSGLGLLAVALIFGYAPDVLLRMMDQKATTLLGQAQSKNDPSSPPASKPSATA